MTIKQVKIIKLSNIEETIYHSHCNWDLEYCPKVNVLKTWLLGQQYSGIGLLEVII